MPKLRGFSENEAQRYLNNGELILGTTTITKPGLKSRRISFILKDTTLRACLPSGTQRKYLLRKYHRRQFKRLYKQTFKLTSRSIHPNAYGYTRETTNLAAVLYIQEALRNGFTIVLRGDFQNCFPTVNLGEADAILQELIPDRPELVALNLRVHRLPQEDCLFGGRMRPDSGISQGLSTSTLLLNLILRRFDEFCGQLSPYFMRYIDDFVLCFRTEEEARQALRTIQEYVTTHHPTLRLHPSKTGISPLDTTPILGYSFNPDTYTIHLSQKALAALHWRFEDLIQGWQHETSMKIFKNTFKSYMDSTRQQLSIVEDSEEIAHCWQYILELACPRFLEVFPSTALQRNILSYLGIPRGVSQRLLTGRLSLEPITPFEITDLGLVLYHGLSRIQERRELSLPV